MVRCISFMLLYFLVIVIPVTKVVAEIGLDYVFNDDALRMLQNLDCESQDLIEQCELLCGGSNVCISGKCYCLGASHESKGKGNEFQIKKKKIFSNSGSDSYEDLTRMIPEKLLQIGTTNKPALRSKPALRHHIAHFCPNLEEARTCIRGCMKFGKPAFCGKDHVCYCGHKYDTTDDMEEINTGDVHDQFRDLYLKYFGPEEYSRK